MRGRWLVPSVDLRGAPILDAIAFLREASEQHDPGGSGVGFIVVDPPLETRVTVSARNISVHDLLNEICHQGGLVWQMSSNGIVLRRETELTAPHDPGRRLKSR